MENDRIIFVREQIEKYEKRKILARDYLSTYVRLAENGRSSKKQEYLKKKRQEMLNDGCSEHQIKIALAYVENNYKDDPLVSEYNDAIAMYEKELDELDKKIDIYQFYLDKHLADKE